MDLGSRVTRLRCAAAWAVVTSAMVGLVLLTRSPAGQGLAAVRAGTFAATGLAPSLVWMCATVALVAGGWLWVLATVTLLDVWRGLGLERRWVPAAMRRMAWGLCGVALAGGVAAPACAVGADLPAQPAEAAAILSGLRLPERVAIFASPDARAGAAHRQEATVVVEPGDTLWRIAADHLGPGASDADTTRAWRAIYALNRRLIGPDPDTITPGQRLLLPAVEGAQR